jgi:hypothetical protein
MSRHAGDFFSRCKRLLLEIAILLIFIVALLEFVWTKVSPFVLQIIDALRR